MKYIKSFIIFSLLVFVPLGSWYYLQTGLNYRKEALKELAPKGAIKDKCEDLNVRLGETTVLAFSNVVNDKDFKSRVYNLLDGFDDVPNFGVLLVGETDNWETNEKLRFQGNPKNCNARFKKMTLIDTAGMIRMNYDGSEIGFKKLVEHLAIVLPRKKDKDVVNKEYETQ